MWGVAELGSHVYDKTEYCSSGGCLNALRATSIPQHNYLEVPGLSEGDTRVIVEGWLESTRRTLTPGQLQYIHQVALDEAEEKPTALRLRLLLDIAVTWASYQKIPHLPPSVKGEK